MFGLCNEHGNENPSVQMPVSQPAVHWLFVTFQAIGKLEFSNFPSGSLSLSFSLLSLPHLSPTYGHLLKRNLLLLLHVIKRFAWKASFAYVVAVVVVVV